MNPDIRNDIRITHKFWRIRSFFVRNFGDKTDFQVRNTKIRNDLGYDLRIEQIHFLEYLDSIKNKIKGKFNIEETVYLNSFRFLLGWTQSLMLNYSNRAILSKHLTRNFPRVLFGGALNSLTILASTHFAANQSYGLEGMNLFSFWLRAQFYQLLLSPLSAYSFSLMNVSKIKASPFSLVFCPTKIVSDSLLILSFGLKNSNYDMAEFLWIPTMVLSGLFLQLNYSLNSKAFGYKKVTETISFLKSNERPGILQVAKNNYLGIGAFVLFNSMLPVVLSQGKGSKFYQEMLEGAKSLPEFGGNSERYE